MSKFMFILLMSVSIGLPTLFYLKSTYHGLAPAFAQVSSDSQSDQSFLPSDLMYDNQAIHPSRMNSVFYGDSSRFEPHPVKYDSDLILLADEISVNENHKSVTSRCTYKGLPYSPEEIYEEYEKYTYLGSCKNKHLILTEHYNSQGRGHFWELGLIRRENDMLLNSGEISAGDYHLYDGIRIDSVSDNKLKYSYLTNKVGFINLVAEKTHQSIGDALMELDLLPVIDTHGVWIQSEVDLDSSELTSVFCAAELDYEFGDESEEEDIFDILAWHYISNGKKILSSEDAGNMLQAMNNLASFKARSTMNYEQA